MTVLGAVLLLVLLLMLIALLFGLAQRRRVNQRLDRLANRLSGVVATASKSPFVALGRLEQVIEEREVRQQSREGESRYEAALETLDAGVVVVDENKEVTFANSAAAWYRDGRHSEAVIAQKLDDLLESAMQGEQFSETVTLFGPPKRILFVLAKPIVVDSSFTGAIAVIHDITELEQSNAIRRDFVTNISHELRTPIGAVSLLAETLIDEQEPDVIKSLGSRLFVEAERLSMTVTDLLELSEIEHSNDSEFEPISLPTVIANAHDRVRAAAVQKGVAIEITTNDKNYSVRGDRRQLTSAIFNLLDNAIKFSTPDGGTVTVALRDVFGRAVIEITDDGIGIPRQDLDRVFERFYRVNRDRNRSSGGTGLGLSLVRHIVTNHQGHIAVDSIEGEGTTFTIELPLVSSANNHP